MKLFVILLLSGYFLARENETELRGIEAPGKIISIWLRFLACAAAALIAGQTLRTSAGVFPAMPALLASAAAAVLLRARPACMLAGAFAAFWALRFESPTACLLAFAGEGVAILTVLFFSTGINDRMRRLPLPQAVKNQAGRLLLLLVTAALLLLLYQKIVQIL